jgi:pimeloyl-ACP methyl ester carboxylesterase
MLQLHEDINFHYETMRALGTVPYNGADITEIFAIMPMIKPGDFDSWYQEWFKLAQRVLSTIDETKEASYSPVTLRNVYFRASHYFFVADFFLHGNKDDPRMAKCYELWRHYFDKANALLDIPGKHYTIDAQGFKMPAIIFRTAKASTDSPRPTLIVGGGFESNMEETFHVFGVPAVSPIMDFIIAHNADELSFIDKDKIGLVGMSLGGYLAARAAAFEPRLAAVLCIDGVYSMLEAGLNIFPQGRDAWSRGDAAEFDRLFQEDPSSWSTTRRWFHDDLKYTFCVDSAFEAFKTCAAMTLGNGVAQKIRMPAFIGDAADDMFFEGQPARVAKEIGAHATLQPFGVEQGAQLHCQSGALVYMNQEMLEWFAGVVGH